jgi:hypothetical protein
MRRLGHWEEPPLSYPVINLQRATMILVEKLGFHDG